MLDHREVLTFSREAHLVSIALNKGDAVGQAVASGVGIMSFGIVAAFLAYLLSHVLFTGRGERREQAVAVRRFLATDMGVYLLCLMICDLAPTLSAVCNLKWAIEFLIHHDKLCDFQGAMNQFGVTGSAAFNLFLAIQTFLVLVVRIQTPPWLKWIALTAGWLFPILMTALGPALNQSSFSFYGPTSAGCWLTFGSSNYKAWFWAVPCISLAVLAAMIVLYFLLFLSLSGTLDKMNGRIRSGPSGTSSSGQGGSSALGEVERRGREVRKVAVKMLWFPGAYAILTLPILICVLMAANGRLVPHLVYVISDCLFSALGVADVFIFVATRRHLLVRRSSTLSSGAGPRGIAMTIVTFTSASTPQPWDPDLDAIPELPLSHRSPNMTVVHDEWKVNDIISPHEKIRKSSSRDGVWDGSSDATELSVSRSSRRGSRIERQAWSERGEDSRGLVGVEVVDLERGRAEDEGSGRERDWTTRPNTWDMMTAPGLANTQPTRIVHGKAF